MLINNNRDELITLYLFNYGSNSKNNNVFEVTRAGTQCLEKKYNYPFEKVFKKIFMIKLTHRKWSGLLSVGQHQWNT